MSLITNFFKRKKNTPSPPLGPPSNKESRIGPSPPSTSTAATTTTTTVTTVRPVNFAVSAQTNATPVTTGRSIFSVSAYPQPSDSDALKKPISQYDIGLAVNANLTDEQMMEYLDNVWIRRTKNSN